MPVDSAHRLGVEGVRLPGSSWPGSYVIRVPSTASAPAKSSETEAKIQVKTQTKTPLMTEPETALEPSSRPPRLQTPDEVRSATQSYRASSDAIAPAQPKSMPVVAGSVSDELGKAPSEPAARATDTMALESSTTAPVPAPKELVGKADAAQVSAQQLASPRPDPQTGSQLNQPAATAGQPAAARTQAVEPTTPVSAPLAPDQSVIPKPTVNNIDSTAVQAVTTVAPTPAPVAEDASSASETPEPSVVPRSAGAETTVAIAAPKVFLAPTAEELAFAVRMLAPDDAPGNPPPAQTKPPLTLTEPQITLPQPAPAPQPPQAQQPQQPQSQAPSNSKRETQSPAPDTETADTRDPKPAELPQSGQTPAIVTPWTEVSTVQQSEVTSAPLSSELSEPARASPALAAQDTHLMAPELPKTSASSDILLHLTGNNESSAAIRVADRAGSVDVTVHASDPVLRESLRSNLGELSAQLTEQGWKAELLKPAAIAAQSESQQDSHSGGHRSSQQQQSSGGDRQPQRDRRASGGRWQQEFEQQISGGHAHPGGNG
jgi:hypothetical protein